MHRLRSGSPAAGPDRSRFEVQVRVRMMKHSAPSIGRELLNFEQTGKPGLAIIIIRFILLYYIRLSPSFYYRAGCSL